MILGLVRWMQPVHGYDVRRELLSWGADKWANVQPGSIYHALRKLSEEGLLRAVATEQVGARPARTTYEVTPTGEDEFQTLLRGFWWGLSEPLDPFSAAFGFLPALPRSEAAAALRNRANLLRASVASMRASLESDWMRKSKRCTSVGCSNSGRSGRRLSWAGASGSRNGSNPVCRTCLLSWRTPKVGRVGGTTGTRRAPTRNNQR